MRKTETKNRFAVVKCRKCGVRDVRVEVGWVYDRDGLPLYYSPPVGPETFIACFRCGGGSGANDI